MSKLFTALPSLVLFLLFNIPVNAGLILKVGIKTDVIIIGAGLSGLATAYDLKAKGIPYKILETTPRIGGRVRTVSYKIGDETIKVDSGMEEYWESNPAVKIIKQLKLPMTADVALSSIMLDNKLEPLLNEKTKKEFLTRILSDDGVNAINKLEGVVAPILTQIRDFRENHKPFPQSTLDLINISFADWIAKLNLPPRAAAWVRSSLECEIGTPWSRISALDGIDEYSIFMGAGEKSYRVTGGNQKFTDAFANAVGKNNILLNKKVNRIVTQGDKVLVYYLDLQTNAVEVAEAKNVVSTIPLYRMFEIEFEPALSEAKRNAIATQGWGAYFKTHIFLNASAAKYWTRNGQTFTPIVTDTNLGVIYEAESEPRSRTKILSLLITGDFAEAYNMTPLDKVRAEIEKTLEKIFPGITKDIKGMEFYRFHPRAIAAWPPGRSRFDEKSEAIRKPENNVYFAGDFTETSHSDGAFMSAARVAKQISEKMAVKK